MGWDPADIKKMPKEARPFYEDVSRWDGIGVTEGRVSQINLAGVGVIGAMPGTRFFQGLPSAMHNVVTSLTARNENK